MSINKCFPCLRFKRFENVTKLDFSNMMLEKQFPEVWQHEQTLEELQLTSTRIDSLPPQLFYCQSLRVLVINNNNLESLPNAIGSLRQLQHLNAARNMITSVPDSIKSCKNLKYLDLSCNNLQRLPNAITSLISLEELLLNETYLEFLPANFGRLINLRILELRLNSLITLPKSMARLTNLQRIDIGGNEFTELPDVVGEFRQLRELWIDFNQIRRITPNIAKLTELQHFEANSNLLETLPHEIGNWQHIDVLSLCTNDLTSLPYNIGMMKFLVTLKCESNELLELPDSISNLECLEELIVSHNHLQQLPKTIGMLRKLRYLFADDNELHLLPDELCNCNNLCILSVNRNCLTALPQNIGNLTQMRVLNIVQNLINDLPVSLLRLKQLTSLWIADNQAQPLVPLQYTDFNMKTKLTCFMLPQVRRQQQQQQQQQDVDHYTLKKSGHQQQRTQQQQQRRICFAEKATVLSTKTEQSHLNDSHNNNKCYVDEQQNIQQQQQQHPQHQQQQQQYLNADVEQDMLGRIRLIRSPTPYPKELRIMAKYMRPSGIGTCSKQQSVQNDHQQYEIQMTTATDLPPSIATPSEINLNDNAMVNVAVDNGMHMIDNHLVTTTPLAYSIAEQKTLSSPHFDTTYLLPALHQRSADNSQQILAPPPYHIACEFTKKSSADLQDFATLYMNLQQQQNSFYNSKSSNCNYEDESDVLVHGDKGNDASEDGDNDSDVIVLRQLPFNASDECGKTTNHQQSISKNLNDNVILPLQQQQPHQLQNGDGSNSSSNNDDGNSDVDASKWHKNEIDVVKHNATQQLSNKKPTWLFGVHKNPTVIQVTLKLENALTFDIDELPGKKGIFVNAIAPNTNAARLLCFNDKILEIDAYDLSNATLQEAKYILSSAGNIINLMLSRF